MVIATFNIVPGSIGAPFGAAPAPFAREETAA
jgi:hypothetical protein